ncbi:DUF4232 domain-containing protein [Planosporangium thailandense]|uniref:DUF4232 domain-containing protein n=1 Tax=Planosporangium thailandense TaxID=765197 RepID=A0ABX0XW59_9ACTN|nr:DUF4232 domain-containing protein [Planosporangium thailandense]NJC69610.1 DUF4232 domain-containing protein [Planosporangium thailandense]
MGELEYDSISAAFADFRHREAASVRPAGMAAVRATVRHRRRVRVLAASALTALAIAVPAAGYAYVSGGRHTPTPVGVTPNPTASASVQPTAGPPSPAPDPSTPSSASPGGTATTSTPPQVTACRADQLTGAVTKQGSMASQPFVIIALTNTAGSPCQLTDYPKVTATGHPQSAPTATGTLPTTVTDGSIYERTDPGPQRIELPPHGAASFALGTTTAYEGGAHLYMITQVRVVVPGNQTGIPVTVDIPASTPTGQPIPITVTAFVAGTAGPP